MLVAAHQTPKGADHEKKRDPPSNESNENRSTELDSHARLKKRTFVGLRSPRQPARVAQTQPDSSDRRHSAGHGNARSGFRDRAVVAAPAHSSGSVKSNQNGDTVCWVVGRARNRAAPADGDATGDCDRAVTEIEFA